MKLYHSWKILGTIDPPFQINIGLCAVAFISSRILVVGRHVLYVFSFCGAFQTLNCFLLHDNKTDAPRLYKLYIRIVYMLWLRVSEEWVLKLRFRN
jgi:hypothetical protein